MVPDENPNQNLTQVLQTRHKRRGPSNRAPLQIEYARI